MDREKAINCIQDLLDVAKVRGTAYIYKRNDTFSEMENVLDCLQNSEPVVRCKDCRHAACWQDAFPGSTSYFCPFRQLDEVSANDFCSYGERKE